MRIYLVRHAEALSREVDPERGLSNEGKQEAEKVAGFLKGLAIEVEAVWESGKKRATQTAEIMASAVRSKGGIVRRSGIEPNDPVEPIAEKLSSLDGDYMLVGHLPFLGVLASRLILGREEPDVVRFPACSVACLAQGTDKRWAVNWMLTPSLL